jgi:hypothetical protein
MGMKCAVLKISWNTQNFSSARMPTQGMMYPPRCFSQTTEGKPSITVNSMLFATHGACWLHESACCMRNILTEANFHTMFTLFQSFTISIFCFNVKTIHFLFDYYMGVLFSDIADWCVKDFGYSVTQSQIQLASAVIKHYDDCNGTWVKKDD